MPDRERLLETQGSIGFGAGARYLILGGAPKCGTTSLFRYLSEHPQICACNRKETYFFAREFDRQGVCELDITRAAFETYFQHCGDLVRTRVEGTPYTLYSARAARDIDALLPDALVLFILRDPVKRLLSDYAFHRQRQHPSTRGTFEDFLEWQRTSPKNLPNLLDLGCYARYLRPFFEILGRERVIIMFFEDLVAQPTAAMHKLSERLGIDPAFYEGYEFGTHNPTINYRSSVLNELYMKLEPVVADLRAPIMRSPPLYRTFERLIDTGKSAYRKINNRAERPSQPQLNAAAADLTEYYASCNEELYALLDEVPPWRLAREPDRVPR